MRAALLNEPRTPLEIAQVDLDPPREGELLVRVEAAGVCHSDYHYQQGDLRCSLPAVLGHEGAGIIEAIGPGVRHVAVGDAVSLLWRPRCGECRACLAGHSERCALGRVEAMTGGLLDGTSRLSRGGAPLYHLLGVSCFAERCVVPERSVVPLPDGVPFPVAAVAGCAVITGVGAVLNALEHPTGRSLLVVGAGGVGCATVMGAVVAGAFPIIVVDANQRALDLARSLGATDTVLAGDDVEVAIRDRCPEGVEYAIEAVGRPETLRLAFSALRSGGMLVAVGLGAIGQDFALPINDLVQQEKRVVGSLYGSASPALELPRIFALYQSGKLPLDRLIGATYSLEGVNDAFSDLVAAGRGRGVLIPGS